MIDTVSALALGALGGMTLTGALMQIVSLNPARKLIATLEAEKVRQRQVIETWREAHDRVAQEADVLGRDVVALLAFKKKRNRSAGQRARDKAASRALTIEKTAALRGYADQRLINAPVAGVSAHA